MYYQNNRSGGGRSDNRYGGGRDSGRQPMHKAVCANCGNDCEVPFRPSSGRPIYCSKCFEDRGGGDRNSRGSDGRNFGRPNFEEGRTQPPYGGDRGRGPDQSSGQLIERINSLHVKLDKIISVLEPKAGVPNVVVPKVVKPTTPKKEMKKEKVKTLLKS